MLPLTTTSSLSFALQVPDARRVTISQPVTLAATRYRALAPVPCALLGATAQIPITPPSNARMAIIRTNLDSKFARYAPSEPSAILPRRRMHTRNVLLVHTTCLQAPRHALTALLV